MVKLYGWKKYFWAVDEKLELGFYQYLFKILGKIMAQDVFSSNRAAGFESSSMRGFECSSASIGNWLIGKGPTYFYTWVIRVLIWIGANIKRKHLWKELVNFTTMEDSVLVGGNFLPAAVAKQTIGKWEKLNNDEISFLIALLFFYVV